MNRLLLFIEMKQKKSNHLAAFLHVYAGSSIFMKCGDHEFLGLSEKPQNESKKF